MFKILNSTASKIITLIIISTFLLIKVYMNSYYVISQNKYMKAFDTSVEQFNLSITEFLSTFESAVEMLSKNEMIQYVSDNPDKYYDSTLELLKNFQQAYSYTAFAYFAPEKEIFGYKKLVSWPDTSEELSNADWVASERPWYINAMNSRGKPVWTRPYRDSTTKKHTITISKDVVDKENKFKGVMAIDIYLEDLSKKINYFKSFNEGDTFIVSRIDNENFHVINSTENNSTENEKSKTIFDEDLINKLYSKKSGSLYSESTSGSYYVSYITNAVTGWKVVGVIEKRKLKKESKDIINNIIIGITIILFMSIISILYIKKQMGNTIETLSGAIKNTEEKELPQSMKIKLFQTENEEIIFENSTLDINILFEIEAEKEKISNILKNIKSFNISNAEEIKFSLTRLASYTSKLNLGVKSHEIQMVSVNNFLITLREQINSLCKSSETLHLKEQLTEICEIADTIINS